MGKTNITWADRVWNPVTGCTKVSEGCRNCYAERMAEGVTEEDIAAIDNRLNLLRLLIKR